MLLAVEDSAARTLVKDKNDMMDSEMEDDEVSDKSSDGSSKKKGKSQYAKKREKNIAELKEILQIWMRSI